MNADLLDIMRKMMSTADSDSSSSSFSEACLHVNVSDTSERRVCIDCGEILNETDSYVYHQVGTAYNKQVPSVNNIRRKNKTCTANCVIYSYIPQYVSRDVKDRALALYKSMTENKFYRSALRKSIIIACIYKAGVEMNAPLDVKDLFYKFSKVSTESINKSLIYMANTAACDATIHEFNSDEIYISSLLKDIVVNGESLISVAAIISYAFAYVKNHCDIVKSSHFKSIVFSLTYYYLTKIKFADNITPQSFSTQCKISKHTLDNKTNIIGDFYARKMAKGIFFRYIAETLQPNASRIITSTSQAGKPDLVVNLDDSTITNATTRLPLDTVSDMCEWNKLYTIQRRYDGRRLYDVEFTRYRKVNKYLAELHSANDTDFLRRVTYDEFMTLNS